MDQRLTEILEALLCNVDVLSEQLDRLNRSDQFPSTPQSLQMIERIRSSCTNSLQNLRTAELRIYRKKKLGAVSRFGSSDS